MTGRLKGSKNKCKSHIYTEEHKQFLEEMYKNYDVNKLTNMFNKKFNLKKTKTAISASLKRYNFKTDRTGRFNLKTIPWNKGTIGVCKLNKTSFKKGNPSHNHRNIGSERISVDGYTEVKVEEPKKWRKKHQVIYEKHKGLIPKGYVVIFLDQDRTNFDIDNLELISKSELLILNRKRLIKSDPGLTASGILVAKLIDKTNKLMRSEINEK